jgi:hypothetical protein
MMLSLVLGLALALPYPAPHSFQPTDATKCSWATVMAVLPEKHELVGRTVAGLVKFQFKDDTPVFAKDGKPAGAVARLGIGQALRVYFVIDNGARLLEVDLE